MWNHHLYVVKDKQWICTCVVSNFHPGLEKLSIMWKIWNFHPILPMTARIWSNNSDITLSCWRITYFSFLLTAAIFDLICFCRAYSLAFLLLLNFLFTQGYFISARVKIFYVIAIFFNSVYRVEISTRVENLYIIGPLIELNLRKQKWLIIYNYNPRNTMIKGYLQYISKEIDSLSSK